MRITIQGIWDLNYPIRCPVTNIAAQNKTFLQSFINYCPLKVDLSRWAVSSSQTKEVDGGKVVAHIDPNI